MKIGFFGTPEIASYCLTSLSKKHEILFVVTAEDKPSGRDLKIQFNPVKTFAIGNNIPLFQPVNLKNPEFISELKNYSADIYVVVAYGRIIPEAVYNYPKYKTVNLHPSMLPKYRGAAPIQWALINGEMQTGATVQRINDKLDSGDIILQKNINLNISINAEELYNIVLPAGAELLHEAIERFANGTAVLTMQNESDATYCSKINKETARIDWTKSAIEIHNLVRGLNPKPGAWTNFRGKNFKIWKTLPADDIQGIDLKPGETYCYMKKRFISGTGSGLIEILEIQQETKKVMDSVSFLNGCRLIACEKFT
jgi:methionyl-tRNA formyltransferase